MRRLLGFFTGALAFLSLGCLITARAAEVQPKEFSTLDTHSKLKFNYNDTSYEPSNIRIKFGGEVTSDVLGYNNTDAYEYGVIVLAYSETSEADIASTTFEKLGEHKTQHHAIACPIDKATITDKFEFSWVIKNTNLAQKYTAAMYRVELATSKLELARPISRSVSETAEAYLDINSSLDYGKAVTRALGKIADMSGVEYTVDHEFLKKEIDWWSNDTKHNYLNSSDYDLYAYVWGESKDKEEFIKVVDNRFRVRASFNHVLFTYVNKGTTPASYDNMWYHENIQMKTNNLYIRDGRMDQSYTVDTFTISLELLEAKLKANQQWDAPFISPDRDLYILVMDKHTVDEKTHWIKLDVVDGMVTMYIPKQCNYALFAGVKKGENPKWKNEGDTIWAATNDIKTEDIYLTWK